MKSKHLMCSIIALISSSAILGSSIINSTQAQSTNSDHNSHHPSTKTSPPAKEMMMNMDQHFIEMMILHHQQAVEMADLALTRAQHPEIKNLAITIKKDQTGEIQQMQSLYQVWYGKQAPVTAMNHQQMMTKPCKMCQQMNPDMMKMPMNGKMKCMNLDLETLKNAADFDQEFIRQMIPHHRHAVKMSQMVLKKSQQPEIRNLAESIITSQTAEINQMLQWYETWYKSKLL